MELTVDSPAARGVRRYISLVAAALGLTGDTYCVELEPYLAAYVALDGRVPRFPGHEVALVWDEYHGWAVAVESRSGEDLLVVSYLAFDVLPAPRVVARFARDLLAGCRAGQPERPALRRPGTGDDLAERLASYAPVG